MGDDIIIPRIEPGVAVAIAIAPIPTRATPANAPWAGSASSVPALTRRASRADLSRCAGEVMPLRGPLRGAFFGCAGEVMPLHGPL